MLIYKYPADTSDDFHSNIREFLEEGLRNPGTPDNPAADLLPEPHRVARQTAIRALILELEDNLKTAGRFQHEHSYVAPANAEWLNRRANVPELEENVQKDFITAYDKIRRWKAIVDSGIHPLIGSLEIPKICQELKSELPPLIVKLKQLLRE